MNWNTEGTW